jgi:competence protein ComEC
MPPLLALGLAAALVEPLSPSAAASLAWLAGLCAAWLAGCARLVAGFPYAETSSPLVLLAPAVAVAAPLAWRRLGARKRRRALAAVGAAVAVAGLGLLAWSAFRSAPQWRPPTGLRATFVDVGQGDAVLVEVPEGGVLVDQGPPEARLAERLRRAGLRSLSALVLTHPQRDHVGGAAEILRRLRVGLVVDPGLAAGGPEQREALEAARRRDVPVAVARSGDVFRLGRLVLRVLWPDGPGSPEEDPNRRAIVILASYGATDLLLTADAESDVTARLRLAPVEILKVAHHGSEDPGLPGILSVLRPRVAVISVGRENDYGHPRQQTLAALEAVPGLRLHRTDQEGTIVVESDGRTLTVEDGGRVP